MSGEIRISWLNDFIFCPLSIYFRNLYGEMENFSYKESPQLLGSAIHKCIDEQTYSSRSNILQGISCYCEKYNLIGKIDLFDIKKKELTERKRTISCIYDGYIYQLYAEYYSLLDMGYEVTHLRLYSYSDNKIYKVALPSEDQLMNKKFEKTINDLRTLDIDTYVPKNKDKCIHCIYSNACDRSLV